MPYEFTNDWCTTHEQDWREVLAGLTVKDGVWMAEIGTFEGRSACWFVDNVLTGKNAKILCIDPWADYSEKPGTDMAAIQARFYANVSASTKPWAFAVNRGTSLVLTEFERRNMFDAIYIDGSHAAADVLADAVNAWGALKVGGLLMFDDYKWSPAEGDERDKPSTAIDAFMFVMKVGGRATVVREGQDLPVLRKERE